MHDLVIRNARIIDGLGNPSQHGAIAVKADALVKLALLVVGAIAMRRSRTVARYCRYSYAL